MRFALLCDDLLASPVVNALSDQVDGHQLSFAVRATPRSDQLRFRADAKRFVERWEDLPVEKEIDAILVGGSDPTILDGTKQLATSGIPILLVPHAEQGSTFVYELSLIRDDNQVPLFPLFWHRYDAAVLELKHAIDEGRIGRIQFLQLNRALTRPSTSTPISQATVDAELLHDADLLRWLIGDYDQVTALRTAATNEGVLMQTVILAGRSLPEANWSICPIDGLDQWRLTVRGESGIAELHRNGPSQCWVCEINGRHVEGDERRTAQGDLDAFSATTINHKTLDSIQASTVNREWGDLVKCFETVDATHRSVRRRRTIELHFEPMSERAIFKTQMTAIGCGLLVATFFLMLLYLGVASFVEPNPRGQSITASENAVLAGSELNQAGDRKAQNPSLPLAHRLLLVLRMLVFAPLVLFLLAQILLPLTRPSSNERPEEGGLENTRPRV